MTASPVRPRVPIDKPPVDVASLFREHAQDVARWVRRLGGPNVDVEDLVQDVFVLAHRYREQFRGEADVTTWLFRITARRVASQRRRQRLQQLWRSLYIGERIEAQPLTPVEELERGRDAERLRRALDRLGEKQRNVFVLFEIEGMSGEAIAALTGQRTEAVWVQLHRARARIRKHLAKEDRHGKSG